MSEISSDQLVTLLERLQSNCDRRVLIGIAGAPGSGKSTLCEWLSDQLNAQKDHEIAAIVPQDGYHYDNVVLEQRNRLDSKGAPDTFDVAGLYSLVQRLRVEKEVAVPVFDRNLEISRNCARIVSPDHKILLVEGNYLLLDKHSEWSQLKLLFDLTVFLETPLKELQRRLQQRWIDYGLPIAEAIKKAQSNDMINARYVIRHSAKSDYIIRLGPRK